MITVRGPVNPIASGGPGTRNWVASPQSTDLKECLNSDPLCVCVVLVVHIQFEVQMIQ